MSPNSTTSSFNLVSSGILMLSGAILVEPIVLTLGHLNSGGLAVMDAMSPWLNHFFDSVGVTDVLHGLANTIPAFETVMPHTYGAEISTNVTPPVESINAAMDAVLDNL
ncbi:MAG: hypothetical protein R3E13_11190 [Alphaproteobacteria bacterium]